MQNAQPEPVELPDISAPEARQQVNNPDSAIFRAMMETCPVKIIGHFEGFHYFVATYGEVRRLRLRHLSNRTELRILFGMDEGDAWLKYYFPKTLKPYQTSPQADIRQAGSWLLAASHTRELDEPPADYRAERRRA